MYLVCLFLAGALIFNSVPHLVAGLQGMPFPTPFAKPPGRGNSSALVNFIWGSFNLVLGLLLLIYHPFSLLLDWPLVTFLAGGLAIGLHLSIHFGNVRRGI